MQGNKMKILEQPEQQTLQVTHLGQFVKKLFFEIKKSRHELEKSSDLKPSINFKLATKKTAISENDYEVILYIEVVAKLGEKGEELFKTELEYAGIFRLTGSVPEEVKEEVLLVNCITMLFPFARREIANAILGGGFQAVMLDPIDFKNVYLQYKQQSKTKLEANDLGLVQ